MSLSYVYQCLRRKLCVGALVPIAFVFADYTAAAQSITPAPPSQSSQPEVTKSPEGKKEEAERAAARASARHFDRVLIIVLENVDYEVASKDKNLADLAAHGASFTNFHALFHP